MATETDRLKSGLSIRRARRKTTDAIDVETILRALVDRRRDERGLCAMVRLADVAAEDERSIGCGVEGIEVRP